MSSERYSDRQLGILTGKVTDLSDDEIDWFDKHDCDVIPGDDGLRHSAQVQPQPPEPSEDFSKLSTARPVFVPPTFIAKSAEALEKKEDD